MSRPFVVLVVDPGQVTGAVLASWRSYEEMVSSARRLGPIEAVKEAGRAGRVSLQEVDSQDPFLDVEGCGNGRFGEECVAWHLREWIVKADVVVIEDFILRRSERSRDLLSPVRIGAKLESLVWWEGGQAVVWQSASDKSIYEAQVDREFKRGIKSPHVRDALSHLCLFLGRSVG